MATFECCAQFERDFAALTRAQQEEFKDAFRELVAALVKWEKTGRELPGKKIRGSSAVRELRIADAVRATWQLGEPRRAGEAHVIWRRVGLFSLDAVELKDGE